MKQTKNPELHSKADAQTHHQTTPASVWNASQRSPARQSKKIFCSLFFSRVMVGFTVHAKAIIFYTPFSRVYLPVFFTIINPGNQHKK